MRNSSENILNTIAEEYPDKVEEMELYKEIKPPVDEEYLAELCGDSEVLKELFEDMVKYFYRYTYDVCAQESLKKEGIPENLERIREMDDPRSILHDAMIDSVRIFARALRKENKDTSWFDPIDSGGRAKYANLALLTTFLDILRTQN